MPCHTLKELIDGRVFVLCDSATGAQPLRGAHGNGAVHAAKLGEEKPSVVYLGHYVIVSHCACAV